MLPLQLARWCSRLAGQLGVGATDPDLFDRLVAEARATLLASDKGSPSDIELARYIASTCDRLAGFGMAPQEAKGAPQIALGVPVCGDAVSRSSMPSRS